MSCSRIKLFVGLGWQGRFRRFTRVAQNVSICTIILLKQLRFAAITYSLLHEYLNLVHLNGLIKNKRKRTDGFMINKKQMKIYEQNLSTVDASYQDLHTPLHTCTHQHARTHLGTQVWDGVRTPAWQYLDAVDGSGL